MSRRPHSSHSRAPTAGAPEGSSAPDRAPALPKTRKGPGGAPRLNTNAKTHGAYLNQEKRKRRRERDRLNQRFRKESREILKAHGLLDDPLARILGEEMAFQRAMRRRIEKYLETRGYMTVGGSVKPATSKALEVSARVVDESRKLLEKLLDRQDDAPGTLAFEITYVGDERQVGPLKPGEEPKAVETEPHPDVKADEDADVDEVEPLEDFEPGTPEVEPPPDSEPAPAVKASEPQRSPPREPEPGPMPVAASETSEPRGAEPRGQTPAERYGWRTLWTMPD